MKKTKKDIDNDRKRRNLFEQYLHKLLVAHGYKKPSEVLVIHESGFLTAVSLDEALIIASQHDYSGRLTRLLPDERAVLVDAFNSVDLAVMIPELLIANE